MLIPIIYTKQSFYQIRAKIPIIPLLTQTSKIDYFGTPRSYIQTPHSFISYTSKTPLFISHPDLKFVQTTTKSHYLYTIENN